jgi:hypothetical protein
VLNLHFTSIRNAYVVLLGLALTVPCATFAAPPKNMCDLVPREKAAELMGTPVTSVSPPVPIQPNGICSYVGGTRQIMVVVQGVPPNASAATFWVKEEHITDLGASAVFKIDNNGTQLTLYVLTSDNKALLGMAVAGITDPKNPTLRAALIQAAKGALPYLSPDPSNVAAATTEKDGTPAHSRCATSNGPAEQYGPLKTYRGMYKNDGLHPAVFIEDESKKEWTLEDPCVVLYNLRGGQFRHIEILAGPRTMTGHYGTTIHLNAEKLVSILN